MPSRMPFGHFLKPMVKPVARVVLLLVLLYLLYAAIATLLVDAWGSQLLSSQLQQRTGHAASVEQMRFNPFTN